jgi:hypothetical protein
MTTDDDGDTVTLPRSRALADGMLRQLTAGIPKGIVVLGPPPPPIEPEGLLAMPPTLPRIDFTAESVLSVTRPLSASPSPLVQLRYDQAKPTRRIKAGQRKMGSRLHWAALAMCAAIGVGLWQDPAARQRAVQQLKAETHRVKDGVVARSHRMVKLVSARII